MQVQGKNPYQPGVGTIPPYLAGRDPQLTRFERLLDDYPEKRNNLRITGLRGVGKTVLLKEFEKIARRKGWVVVRRDLSARLSIERDFELAIAEYLRLAVDDLSRVQKLRHLVGDAMKAIGQIGVDVEGVTMSVSGGGNAREMVLEDRIRNALIKVGELARGRGVVFLFDEAHSIFDIPRKHQYALGALLSAFVAVQDVDEPPMPVMLVLCGLPPLIANIHRARSNAERLFKSEHIANLPLDPLDDDPEGISEAVLALVKPALDIVWTYDAADQIARDVDGYPFFIQWFGEALWDAATEAGTNLIDEQLYRANRKLIQRTLDDEFFEPRYRDARRADQGTLRVAASLGGERFEKSQIDGATTKSTGAVSQSLNRLINDNLLFRDDHGVYAYTAPLFGNFLRRRHPQLEEDI